MTNSSKIALGIGVVLVILVAIITNNQSNNGNVIPVVNNVNNAGTTPAVNNTATTNKKISAPKNQVTNPVVLDTFSVDFVAPVSGPVGTMITIHGQSFSTTGNTVILNKNSKIYFYNLSSPDRKTITITIPASTTINGKVTPLETGTYDVSVRDARGKESNLVSFVVIPKS